MARVVVTRRLPFAAIDRLARAGHEVVTWPGDLPPTGDELRDLAAGADALLTLLTDRVDGALLDAAPSLRAVAVLAVGTDSVDLAACRAHGVKVGNTPDVLTDATADLTLALILAAARRLPEASAAVRAGAWRTWEPAAFLGLELRGATLGIVGFGRIGRRVAEKARGFGLRLLACDPFLSPDAGTPYGATLVELDALLREADFVSLHCPLDAGTRGLIGAAQLARMKPTGALINTARGPLVDTAALVAALADGALAAAALDVTDPEPPPPEHPLLALPNLLLTPHSAYYSDRARAEVRRRAVEHALGVLRGRWPEGHVANPAVRERLAALREAGGAPPAERQG